MINVSPDTVIPTTYVNGLFKGKVTKVHCTCATGRYAPHRYAFKRVFRILQVPFIPSLTEATLHIDLDWLRGIQKPFLPTSIETTRVVGTCRCQIMCLPSRFPTETLPIRDDSLYQILWKKRVGFDAKTDDHYSIPPFVQQFGWMHELKLMLKRLHAEKLRGWDRYLGSLLFAYHETPHSSLKFAPFDVLYSRTVHSPIATCILRKLWTGKVESPKVKTIHQHVLNLCERLEKKCEITQQNLQTLVDMNKHY